MTRPNATAPAPVATANRRRDVGYDALDTQRNTTANIATQSPPTALEMSGARAEPRSRLYSIGEIDLHDAVNARPQHAERHALIDHYGQGLVQLVIDEAFKLMWAGEPS